eukprot:CAMPEP_0171079412 /NCGR_PEP_ID=MMETSP0766_2-20121228/15243_1 /TAXON_ID=439317 /ORGANISM="Gambierdiscus australes, Strain CAWD 149" /LENGTH=199 /DNA_ID=CAMNT_0011536601 /DNA_START=52 /DNA_END=653 /DNA_ORIENTATION=-
MASQQLAGLARALLKLSKAQQPERGERHAELGRVLALACTTATDGTDGDCAEGQELLAAGALQPLVVQGRLEWQELLLASRVIGCIIEEISGPKQQDPANATRRCAAAALHGDATAAALPLSFMTGHGGGNTQDSTNRVRNFRTAACVSRWAVGSTHQGNLGGFPLASSQDPGNARQSHSTTTGSSASLSSGVALEDPW